MKPAKTTVLILVLACAGCAAGKSARLGELAQPLDVVIVPGCPNEADGRASGCQIERARYAALLWERRMASRFITSGSAVHSPWVEADTIAELMVALGVPAERILLERDALHTDENMYYSLRIARRIGARTLGVSSQAGHARAGCAFISGWGQPCTSLPVDRAAARARAAVTDAALRALRFERDPGFVELGERERSAAEREHRRRRPASFLVYAAAALMSLNGEVWMPLAQPPPLTILSFADRSKRTDNQRTDR